MQQSHLFCVQKDYFKSALPPFKNLVFKKKESVSITEWQAKKNDEPSRNIDMSTSCIMQIAKLLL